MSCHIRQSDISILYQLVYVDQTKPWRSTFFFQWNLSSLQEICQVPLHTISQSHYLFYLFITLEILGTHMTKKQEGQKKRQPFPHPRLKSLYKKQKAEEFKVCFFYSYVCLLQDWETPDMTGSVMTGRERLCPWSSVSHPQSDPCCVFLPGLVVCTDTHSDNSTADTERNLCVSHEGNHFLIWFGKGNHEGLAHSLTLLWYKEYARNWFLNVLYKFPSGL